jgi:hypothetical protein
MLHTQWVVGSLLGFKNQINICWVLLLIVTLLRPRSITGCFLNNQPTPVQTQLVQINEAFANLKVWMERLHRL